LTTYLLSIGIILLVDVPQGQKSPGKTDVHAEVNSFVHSERLPKAQSVNILFQLPSEDLFVFWVDYGDANEVYSRATGLKRQNKIGWLAFRDSESLDLNHFHHYDIDSADSLLFAGYFWRMLESSDLPVYRYALLPVLVKDKDTPAETLKRIAEGLHTFIDPHLAHLMLTNEKVRVRRDILTLIANLPVFRGDAYRKVRQDAKNLLSKNAK